MLALCAARDYDALAVAARDIAVQRRQRHSPRFTKEQIDEEEAGIHGEIAFARAHGYDPRPIVSRSGSGPTDFVLPGGYTCDIKASWNAALSTGKHPNGRLMVEAGHCQADVYVFGVCHVDDDGNVAFEFKGWEFGHVIRKLKPTREGRYGLLSHRIAAKKLRTMERLERLMVDKLRVAVRLQAEQREAVLETTTTFDGAAVGVRWAVDRRSASIEIDEKRIGLIYALVRGGKRVWVDAYDERSKEHAVVGRAIDAAVKRCTSRERDPAPSQRTRYA